MNLFFVTRDGTLVTPELTGTILEGVTRDSILELAEELRPRRRGAPHPDRRVAATGVASGEIAEVFACGTAAVVTPVGRAASGTAARSTTAGDGATGDRSPHAIRAALLDIQYGRAEDTHGWLTRLV